MKKIQSLDRAKSSSSAMRDKYARTRCWSLNIKKKVKHFVWKCFFESFHVSLNLKRRGVAIDWIVSVVVRVMKVLNICYLIVARAKKVWKLLPLNWDFEAASASGFKD
ncbi:ribonuclease H-like superfamily protein [Striga asiatica]|uniref:Ribonuclease H-like superfamily protein n=1 Tax=Striga asiatica TaxID=4170 RepID=A0A5A7PJ46_STRAF|nr:ribonuclease H-like superfamily protein [Striga asiatica]